MGEEEAVKGKEEEEKEREALKKAKEQKKRSVELTDSGLEHLLPISLHMAGLSQFITLRVISHFTVTTHRQKTHSHCGVKKIKNTTDRLRNDAVMMEIIITSTKTNKSLSRQAIYRDLNQHSPVWKAL